MSQDDDELQEFLEIFREESADRLVNVSRMLEALAGGADAGPHLDEVDRELHTIKGSARLLGFAALGKLVHDLEGLARAYRARPALGLALLVEATDRLTTLVEESGKTGEDRTDEALHARVRAALEDEPPGGGAPAPAPAPGPPVVAVDGGAPERARAGEAGEAEPEQARVAVADPEDEPLQRPASKITTSRHGRGGPGEDELVRVRASRLEALDAVVSDLSLTRLRLGTYEERLRRLLGSVEEGTAGPDEVVQTLRHVLHDYRSDTIQVHRSTQQLQQLAVDVRLRPVEHLFGHVPREARDLARRLGKQVSVRISGAETEMDRVILDLLKAPLSHLIRNALDHGLEAPDERRRAGKPEEGTLSLRAGQEGALVAIHVEDDGRGIDARRIRQLAVSRGLLDQARADAMTDEDAIQLVFIPGFSTRTVASEISGRGVGMDVVRSSVEALKGDVRVQSWPGRGTRTTIRLPLTLLISRVTFVRSAGLQFALPTEQVHESVRLAADRVIEFAGQPAVVHAGQTLPLVRLARVLCHRELPDPPFLRVLVVQHAESRLALVVEELLEQRPVVVKPLGWPLDRVRFMSGAIHMPSGEVALLLHVPDLFSLGRRAEEGRALRPDDRRKTVLVVDDSIVSRQMVSRVVEGLGFDLLTALDGMDALRVLERVRPDLIVTDVEMPRLGGLGLARRLRQEQRLSGVPIVIVSSRGSEADRQAGLEAGADAYLAKADFNEASFRTIVERLL
ncbi:MAG: response regulator [Planctomycetes bacterium]|nr:response regulator [Planctomycetota bacterium]